MVRGLGLQVNKEHVFVVCLSKTNTDRNTLSGHLGVTENHLCLRNAVHQQTTKRWVLLSFSVMIVSTAESTVVTVSVRLLSWTVIQLLNWHSSDCRVKCFCSLPALLLTKGQWGQWVRTDTRHIKTPLPLFTSEAECGA